MSSISSYTNICSISYISHLEELSTKKERDIYKTKVRWRNVSELYQIYKHFTKKAEYLNKACLCSNSPLIALETDISPLAMP